MLHVNKLIEMSQGINTSEAIFQTIRELTGVGRKPRTSDDIRLERNLPKASCSYGKSVLKFYHLDLY